MLLLHFFKKEKVAVVCIDETKDLRYMQEGWILLVKIFRALRFCTGLFILFTAPPPSQPVLLILIIKGKDERLGG